jgi:4-diphosphocytidyl-2-C-methyl-D-erythritol kinase
MLSFKSYAKVNIFLKITGRRGDYHEIKSRFVRIESLHDTMIFKPKKIAKDGFELFGEFDCNLENNTIYKAYLLLKKYKNDKKIDDFFRHNLLYVDKNIPKGGGLGGGSSNAATLLLALNKILKLGLSLEELCLIGGKVSADVNFFLHECEVANVEGIGEVVKPIKDNVPKLELIFTNEACDTTRVYKTFREHFWSSIDTNLANKLINIASGELLNSLEAIKLNDLLRSVLVCYPNLKAFSEKGVFLSGSGGTFFKVANGCNNS